MKTLTITHRTSSRACSFRVNITLALLVGIMLPLMVATTSAQLFYREYDPFIGNNDGRCIINTNQVGDRYISVGEHSWNTSGLAIWTKLNGVYNAGTIYNTGNNNVDYGLNFIENGMVTGSYNTTSYTPTYTGHPATGFKIIGVGSPIVLYPSTWTTIIDPVNRNRIWDHNIIGGADDIHVGVSVVRDQTSTDDFFVLSQIASVSGQLLQRIGVTRYRYQNGDAGHVLDWSQQYNLEEFRLIPVGIVQAANNDIIIAGNVIDTVGGPNRIFTIVIDHVTGAILTQLASYDASGYSEVSANSITGPFNGGDFLISGKAVPNSNSAYLYPLLLSLDAAAGINQWGIYRYKRYAGDEDTYLNGQFMCAKIFNQKIDTSGSTAYRITAVGEMGAVGLSPTQALIMNTSNLAATPAWTRRQGREFFSAATKTIANWFVGQDKPPAGNPPLSDPLLGEYVYIGTQSGGGTTRTVSGGFNKMTGASECATSPYFEYVDNPDYQLHEYDATQADWGTDEVESTTKDTLSHSPYKCSGTFFTIASGNKIRASEEENEIISSQEQAEIFHSNGVLTIGYSTGVENSVNLIIADLLGNTIVEQRVSCPAGKHSFTLSTQDFSTGSYFVALVSTTSRFNKNIIIVK